MNVFNSSGRPGGGMRVTIRGKGSINASNQPLYVVNGVIGVDIELVNTNDIESVSKVSTWKKIEKFDQQS